MRPRGFPTRCEFGHAASAAACSALHPFHCVLLISILVIFISGYPSSGDGDGDSNGDRNECDGPVPCLTKDWGDSEYWFTDTNGNPVVVLSEGNAFAVAGLTDEGYIISVGGTPTDCYNGKLLLGAIDWNDDGEIDDNEWLSSVGGNANICNKTLTISDLVIEGTPEKDVVATYDGVDIYYTDDDVQVERDIMLRTLLHGIIRSQKTDN